MAHFLRVNLRSAFRFSLLTSLHLGELQGSVAVHFARRWYGESAAVEDFFNSKQSSSEPLGMTESKDPLHEVKLVNQDDTFDDKDKKAHFDSISDSKHEFKGELVDGLGDFILSTYKAQAANLNNQGNEARKTECAAPSRLDLCRMTISKHQLGEVKLTDKDNMPDKKDNSSSSSIFGTKREAKDELVAGLNDFISKLKAGAGNLNKHESATRKIESLAPAMSDGKTAKPSESKSLNLNRQGNETRTIGAAAPPKSDGKSGIDSQIWNNVLKSIENFRSKSESSGNSPKMKNSELKDDFVDLDLPEVHEDAISSSGASSKGPLSNLNLLSGVKAKNDGHPLPGNNQKPIYRSNTDFRSPPPNLSMAPRPELPDKDKIFLRMDGSPRRVFDDAICGNDIGQPKGHTVCIQNLPAGCNLGIVRDALSQFGVVTGSFRRPGSNGTCACYVEFQNEDAMEVAVEARWLMINGRCFPIVRTDKPMTTVVRVTKVSPDTAESQIMFMCRKYGNVDTIKKRGSGTFDIYYKANELPNIFKILSSLNEVQANHSRWVAVPAPLIHPGVTEEVIKRKDGQAWVSSQMGRALHRIQLALETATIAVEDLKLLNSVEDGVQVPPKS